MQPAVQIFTSGWEGGVVTGDVLGSYPSEVCMTVIFKEKLGWGRNYCKNETIIDFYTRYTKMGYAGNKEPQFIMPSAIAVKETAKVVKHAFVKISISGLWIENHQSYLCCHPRWVMRGEPPGAWRILIFTLGTRP